jgi:hypothetical protein
MSVGYAEVESQGFIVTALDHSGYLFVDPVNWEHTEEVGLDSIPKIDDLRSENIFRSLRFIAVAERAMSNNIRLTKDERRSHAQRISTGLSTLRAIGEDLSGTAIDYRKYPIVNRHYLDLAVKLDARGTLPHLKLPS